jgi:hypothetical protein
MAFLELNPFFPDSGGTLLIKLCRHVRSHSTNSGKATHNHPKYSKEKHSLQGKTGKTHAVC